MTVSSSRRPLPHGVRRKCQTELNPYETDVQKHHSHQIRSMSAQHAARGHNVVHNIINPQAVYSHIINQDFPKRLRLLGNVESNVCMWTY
jgi:hypothetical protein